MIIDIESELFRFIPRSKQLEFGGELSPEDHNLIMDKIISIQEGSLANGIGSSKVTVEQLWAYRFVVSAWRRCIGECCSTDLKTVDFENARDAVLKGDATCSHQGISFVSTIGLVESLIDLTLGPRLSNLVMPQAVADGLECYHASRRGCIGHRSSSSQSRQK